MRLYCEWSFIKILKPPRWQNSQASKWKNTNQSNNFNYPGLRDHVPEHWQTILETKLAKVRSVPPVEINKLNCENRVAAIQAQLEQIQGPVILVAHSAGVLMTIHWAAKYQRPIQGALLVAPPDLNQSWPEIIQAQLYFIKKDGVLYLIKHYLSPAFWLQAPMTI